MDFAGREIRVERGRHAVTQAGRQVGEQNRPALEAVEQLGLSFGRPHLIEHPAVGIVEEARSP